MSDPELPSRERRVRPAWGILLALLAIASGVLYVKGYTVTGPRTAWLRLLHITLTALLFFWGVKTSLLGDKRRSSDAWIARFVPYGIEVTREGWTYFIIMILVLLGALIGKSNLLLLVFGLLAGPFVLNGHIALTMLARNQVVRQLPERVMQGEWFSVDLTLSNRRWFVGSWMMVVEDHWKQGLDDLYPVVVFTRVGPGQERSGRYQLRLQPRGRHVCGPVRLLTRFPLGLVERSYVMSCPGELLVYPRIGHLTPQWHREHANADELMQQNRTRAGAFEDEFHRLREYRFGDSPRAIHWRTSARRNQLMVRENHQMRDLDLAIVVDLWLPAAPTAVDRARLELALSLAATVCVEHCQHSRESEIFVGIAGRLSRDWMGAAGPPAIPRLLDEFALAEGSASNDLQTVVNRCLQIRSAHVNRILITTRGDREPTVKLVHEMLAESQHRGLPMRLVTADPAVVKRYMQMTVESSTPLGGIGKALDQTEPAMVRKDI